MAGLTTQTSGRGNGSREVQGLAPGHTAAQAQRLFIHAVGDDSSQWLSQQDVLSTARVQALTWGHRDTSLPPEVHGTARENSTIAIIMWHKEIHG